MKAYVIQYLPDNKWKAEYAFSDEETMGRFHAKLGVAFPGFKYFGFVDLDQHPRAKFRTFLHKHEHGYYE